MFVIVIGRSAITAKTGPAVKRNTQHILDMFNLFDISWNPEFS